MLKVEQLKAGAAGSGAWEGLAGWGLRAKVAEAIGPGDADHWILCRVVTWEGSGGRVVSPLPLFAEVRGKLIRGGDGLPVTGDWVLGTQRGDSIIVERILPRLTTLVRRSAGGGSEGQVVVANVDVLFVVTAVNRDFNERRLERYVAACLDSGARPVVILNKADLVEDVASYLARARAVAPGVDVHAVSALRSEGMQVLQSYASEGVTVGLVGSSGVGKSTLVNGLLNEAAADTGPLDATGRGRHTTTRRAMFQMNTGGLLVDTPGMREFGLMRLGEGLDGVFEDVTRLTRRCRFGDCSHTTEPGCAVLAALDAGDLPVERWRSHDKLRREAKALLERTDARLTREAKRRNKARSRSIRAHYRTKHEGGERE